jgi:hypothetical protein
MATGWAQPGRYKTMGVRSDDPGAELKVLIGRITDFHSIDPRQVTFGQVTSRAAGRARDRVRGSHGYRVKATAAFLSGHAARTTLRTSPTACRGSDGRAAAGSDRGADQLTLGSRESGAPHTETVAGEIR